MKLRIRIKNIYYCLKYPSQFINIFAADKKKLKSLILISMVFIICGIVLQQNWMFPHFYKFTCCFLFIGLIGITSVMHFSTKMKHIVATLASQPAVQKGNYIYYKYFANSSLNIVGPLFIIFVFGFGGCTMFKAMQFTPTLVWILILFFVIVYISIIGYLQYIALAVYIRNLANNSGEYKRLQKSAVECIPSQLLWLQDLTKLSHTYRNAFFTLGSAYILAFAGFCLLPEMQADTSSYVFFALWGIIFVAIVIVFPVVSLLEYVWIKKIVEKLKESYIKDLAQENNLSSKRNATKEFLIYQELIQTICATQIVNSKDYPVTSSWTTCYAAALSFFNFIAAVVTVLQSSVGSTFLGVYSQIF